MAQHEPNKRRASNERTQQPTPRNEAPKAPRNSNNPQPEQVNYRRYASLDRDRENDLYERQSF